MFIDTSGFLCLFDVSEPRHEDAKVFGMFQIVKIVYNQCPMGEDNA